MTIETAVTLRPLRLVELLDAAFRLYRRNFWTLLGIMALVQIPITLLSLGSGLLALQGTGELLQTNNFSPAYFIGLGLTVLIAVINIFLLGIANLTMTRSIATGYLGGKLGVLEAYRQTISMFGKVIVTFLLIGLLAIGLAIWFLVPCVGWLTGGGIYFYFVTVITPLTIAILALENLPITASIRRTWELSRRRFWWFLGVAGVLFLLNLVLAGPAAVINMVMQAMSQSSIDSSNFVTQSAISTTLQTVLNLLVSLLYAPLQLCVLTLAYFDVRIRTEGLDLSLAATQTAGEPLTLDSLAQVPAAPNQASLVTGMEIGYFVALTLGAVLLYAILYGILFGLVFGIMGLSRGIL